jgi:hypothetical protein
LVGLGRIDPIEAKSDTLQRERIGIVGGARCTQADEQEHHAKKYSHGLILKGRRGSFWSPVTEKWTIITAARSRGRTRGAIAANGKLRR